LLLFLCAVWGRAKVRGPPVSVSRPVAEIPTSDEGDSFAGERPNQMRPGQLSQVVVNEPATTTHYQQATCMYLSTLTAGTATRSSQHRLTQHERQLARSCYSIVSILFQTLLQNFFAAFAGGPGTQNKNTTNKKKSSQISSLGSGRSTCSRPGQANGPPFTS